MIKPAFSTVACPEWTLDQVAESARQFGFEAVELRSFGPRSTMIACDPALTSDEKTRSMFVSRGIEVLSLATSVSFEEPIKPPILGLAFSDTERTVRAANRAIDLAVCIECPLVRVFGFDIPPRERRVSAVARIVKRLSGALDHARHTGVRVMIENGGAFATAADLAELLDQVRHPLLGACYSIAVGARAGDTPDGAIASLGARLLAARVKDINDGKPVRLGEGDVPCREFVGALARAGFDGPVIFEWDRLWLEGLARAEDVLPHAAATLYQWAGDDSRAGRPAGPAPLAGAR